MKNLNKHIGESFFDMAHTMAEVADTLNHSKEHLLWAYTFAQRQSFHTIRFRLRAAVGPFLTFMKVSSPESAKIDRPNLATSLGWIPLGGNILVDPNLFL